jgi:hypothetical protein
MMYQSGDVLAHFKWVSIFLEVLAQHAPREKEEVIYCQCKLCNNNVMDLYKDREIIHEHLVQSGFMDNYFIWSKHGETQPESASKLLVNFGVLNDNLIKGLISFVKYISRF